MKFTDDDLKRLKEHHAWKPRLRYVEDKTYNALFARLEAAEEYAEHIATFVTPGITALNLKESWRKAAGR